MTARNRVLAFPVGRAVHAMQQDARGQDRPRDRAPRCKDAVVRNLEVVRAEHQPACRARALDRALEQVGQVEETRRGDRRRPRHYLARRPLLDDVSALHQAQMRGEHRRLVEVVSDEQYCRRELGVQALQLHIQALARAAVHRGERLVQQQHAGIAGQRARHCDALLLAARELARPSLLETRDVRLREPRPRLCIAFRGRPVEERAGDVLERRQVRKEPVVLRDVADGTLASRPVDAVRRVEPDVVVERDATTAWPQQPGDRAQQRRLAAARRADDADDLARGEREVEVERRPVVAERDAQCHRPTCRPLIASPASASARTARRRAPRWRTR